MQVTVTAKALYHDRLGKLVNGRVVEVAESIGARWLRRGFAERYETKVMRDRPSEAAGEPSSASPVAQASPSQMSSLSVPGAKKRGRPRKVVPSA